MFFQFFLRYFPLNFLMLDTITCRFCTKLREIAGLSDFGRQESTMKSKKISFLEPPSHSSPLFMSKKSTLRLIIIDAPPV